jgi:hypothetical protein
LTRLPSDRTRRTQNRNASRSIRRGHRRLSSRKRPATIRRSSRKRRDMSRHPGRSRETTRRHQRTIRRQRASQGANQRANQRASQSLTSRHPQRIAGAVERRTVDKQGRKKNERPSAKTAFFQLPAAYEAVLKPIQIAALPLYLRRCYASPILSSNRFRGCAAEFIGLRDGGTAAKIIS